MFCTFINNWAGFFRVLFTGFMTLGHIIFGPKIMEFSTVVRSFESLYSMLIGKFDFKFLGEDPMQV